MTKVCNFWSAITILVLIKGVLSQKCYTCTEQEENVGKCTSTVEDCGHNEQHCLATIHWGSTPYWEIGAPMQHYISKRCASEQECTDTMAEYLPHCQRIWWRDWKCAECCKGDRCNYYITLGSSSVKSSSMVLFFSLAAGYLLYVTQH